MTTYITLIPTDAVHGVASTSDVDELVDFDRAGAGTVGFAAQVGFEDDEVSKLILSGPDEAAVNAVAEVAESSGVWTIEDGSNA